MGRNRSKDFPRYLRAIRVSQGYTQATLAKALGVRANTVARWERGELHPYQHNLERLCTLFGLL